MRFVRCGRLVEFADFPKNIPDQQKLVAFPKSQKSAKSLHSNVHSFNIIFILFIFFMPHSEHYQHLLQGWKFAHSLISLNSNERLWVIRSGRSEEMSEREPIAQVAQDKWATMSDSLRLLRGNEWMSDSLKTFWLKNLIL